MEYVCNECGKTFKSEHGLSTHIAGKHKEFVCDVCNQAVVGSIALRKHKELHQEKQACPECDKEFSSHGALAMHMKFHDDEYKQMISDRTKEAYTNKDVRDNASNALKARWQNPAYKAMMSNMVKHKWNEQEYRSKVTSSLKQTLATDASKAKHSNATKAMWQDDSYRNKVISSMKQTMSTSESKARKSAATKRLWKDSAYRAKRIRALKQYWADEDNKRHTSTNISRALLSSDVNSKIRARSKAMWQDDSYRAKQAELTRRSNDRKHLARIVGKYSDDMVSVLTDKGKLKATIHDDDTIVSWSIRNGVDAWDLAWYVQRHELSDMFDSSNMGSQQEQWWANVFEQNGIEFKQQVAIYAGRHKHADFGNYDAKFAVEIDPAYTHSTYGHCHWGNTPKDYHFSRTSEAEANGWTVFHIWDWLPQDKCISFVKSQMHMDRIALSARKCELVHPTQKQARMFCDKYHLQGGLRQGQQACYGLAYDGELVAISTYGKSRFSKLADWEWLRFCCKDGVKVHGAASYMQKQFLDDYDASFVTYTDYSRSIGKMDEAMGLKLVKYTGPSLVWWDGERNIRDTLLLKLGADRMLGTSYGDSMDNHSIMLAEGFHGIYDCGSKLYINES